eukprot:COSAG06_NODE_5468_length_3461_cov_743.379833_2_plen_68_part_00
MRTTPLVPVGDAVHVHPLGQRPVADSILFHAKGCVRPELAEHARAQARWEQVADDVARESLPYLVLL